MGFSFGNAFRARLAAQRLTLREFSRCVGKPQSHGFMCRVLNEKQPPPLDELERWADALGLTDPIERDQFLELGCMAAMQPQALARYQALKAEVARLRNNEKNQ